MTVDEKLLLNGRLTKRKLVNWCNYKFNQLGLTNLEVTEIFTSKFRQHEYEAGACRLYIKFKNKTVSKDSLVHESSFLSYYTIGQYNEYLKEGYELYLKSKWPHHLVTDFEIEVRKPSAPKEVNPTETKNIQRLL